MKKLVVIFILLASFFALNAQSGKSVEVARKLKNAPTPSSGYGKDLGDFKSGIYTITSAELTRQYTIDIPKNYDKSKTYRLIFAMHMMGGAYENNDR